MLGLKRGEVQIVPHDSLWADIFQEERVRLESVLPGCFPDIQHIGSTAVAGLAAKPIIDIGIGVNHIPVISRCIPPLQSLGYTYLGDRRKQGDHFLVKGPEEKRTFYLHVLAKDNPAWQNYLLFRDHLKQYSHDRHRYEKRKKRLAIVYAKDRDAYTQGKADLIEEILKRARYLNSS